jgi:hypothetical protein
MPNHPLQRTGKAVGYHWTIGQSGTIAMDSGTRWDCEAAGLTVTPGDRVSMWMQGALLDSATDVGGAVTGFHPIGAGCANLTTGQQVKILHQKGATAASCIAAGLLVQPRRESAGA